PQPEHATRSGAAGTRHTHGHDTGDADRSDGTSDAAGQAHTGRDTGHLFRFRHFDTTHRVHCTIHVNNSHRTLTFATFNHSSGLYARTKERAKENFPVPLLECSPVPPNAQKG